MAERLLSIILIYLLHSPTQALLPPKLMVNKQLIAETDSVRVDCQAPSDLTVFRCYFVIVDTKSTMEISCMTSVTGRELLRRSQQTAPAVVQVECFYTLKYGDVNSPSPHSNIFSITIQGSKSRSSTLTPPTSAPNVPAALTPRLPTQTQTQGKRSGSPNPASNWSTDRWVVKVFIALASFGVIVGVVLLGLALRRTVSERTRRSEHQNIEDEYCLYSNITDEVAPSFKENILYSKVEAHEISQQETY